MHKKNELCEGGNEWNFQTVKQCGHAIPLGHVSLESTCLFGFAYLGNESSHKLDDLWIVTKLPNDHDNLFHGDLVATAGAKDLFDEAVVRDPTRT